jgi:hypothetical protein
MEADVLDTAGLRGAEANEETARAATARMMMVVRLMVNARVFVWSAGFIPIVRFGRLMYLMDVRGS